MGEPAEASDATFWGDVDETAAVERFRTLVSTIGDGVFQLDAESRFVAVNDAVLDISGCAREELLGEDVSVLFGDGGSTVEREIERLRTNPAERGALLDCAVQTAEGTRVRCELRVNPLDGGDTPAGAFGVLRDVSGRERTGDVGDERHQQRERDPDLERYETIVQAVDDGVYVVDEDGRFTMVNDAYAEMLGYDCDDLLGEHVSMVVDDDVLERAREAEAAMRDGEVVGPVLEAELETADGGEVTAEATFAMLPGVDGPEHRVGVVRDITERKERERELERYERIVENLPVGVYRNTPGEDGTFVTANTTLASLFGADSVDDLLQHNVSDLYVDPERRAEFSRTLEREGMVEDVELKQETLDGETIWISVTATRTEEDGEVYFDGTVQDITERKLAKQQLEEERDMFAQGPAVVFRWKPDEEEGWPVEYVSENVEDVFGYTPRELESGAVPYTDLLLDEEMDRIAREVEANRDGTTERFSHEPYRVETKDGDVRWVKDTTKIVRDETGEITRYLGYLVDITERKEREQALQESKNQLQALVELLPVAVFVAEADGEIVEWNEAAREIWGGEVVESGSVAEYDEYDGWWADTGEPVEPDEWALARALRGEEVTDPDVIEIEGFDGKRRTVLNHGMPVRDADGEVVRAVVTLTDITERNEYQRRLEASNQRLEQFAYAASHDLQEPLRMVSSYLQLIENRYAEDLDEEGREFIEFAVDGADRMREMIEGLLEYSRIDTGGDPFEPVDLNAVLRDVREDLQVSIEESGADVTSESLPCVEGDEGQLRQVFQNLLDNAIEYSGDDPPRIHLSAERDGHEWVISVRDEGIGIDSDDADSVFEVFQSLHSPEDHSGTGIGLALCQRIVERHGGEIWVESTPGEGSTFAFTLPAVADSHE